MKDMIIKLCEAGISALAYVVTELKAGNLLPCAVALLAFLLLDKDVVRVVLILILIVMVAKVVMK